MTLARTEKAAAPFGLAVPGGLHPTSQTTLLLLGPAAGFWPVFSSSPEARDGHPDPVDRWSTRVVAALAQQLNATPHLPFGGPPYAPFLSWALQSGRCWSSPVGMLVHNSAGLMVSFRGALEFDRRLPLPAPPETSPCDSCTSKPCQTACPVGALGPNGYETQACHGFLDISDGQTCRTKGCLARRACPISPARPNAQSAHHMSYFHSRELGL